MLRFPNIIIRFKDDGDDDDETQEPEPVGGTTFLMTQFIL